MNAFVSLLLQEAKVNAEESLLLATIDDRNVSIRSIAIYYYYY